MALQIEERYYLQLDELEQTPELLSKLGSPYAPHKSIVAVGESADVNEPQKILVLAASEENQVDPELIPVIMQYMETAGSLKHTATVGMCKAGLVQLVYQKALEMEGKKQKQQSPMVLHFMELLADAMRKNVSDIHIEVRRNEAKVRYRIDGRLKVIASWTQGFAFSFCQVVYSVVAEEQDVTFRPEVPQDALIDKQVEGERLRVRLATIPAAPDGFDMIMRLLRLGKAEAQRALALDMLGYSEDQVAMILAGTSKPVGASIIAGTTGSGKSTTLKNLLLSKIEQAENQIKVITVEDPPEYFIPGATQVPASRNKKSSDGTSSFEAAIRGAMRADPDILMVGEVRDLTTAKLLIGMVQSGHQAFTTVHAPSALSIVSRLASMGVERDILGSPDFIATLIYQALLPKLCPHCKIPSEKVIADPEAYHIDPGLILRLKRVPNFSPDKVFFHNEKGCALCGNNGVKGRTVVAEVIMPDNQLLKFFSEAKGVEALEYWLKKGGKTILLHGIEKMLSGIVSPSDVEDSLGPVASMVAPDGSFNLIHESGNAV